MDNGNQSLILFGDAVKAQSNGIIDGYLVRYNNPDTTEWKDFFDNRTDFDFEGASVVKSCRFHHGMSAKAGKTKYGALNIERREDGLFASVKMDFTQPFAKEIYELAQAGKLGWSSGSTSHLIEREKQSNGTNWVKSWPLAEGSLTPIPADPSLRASVKSISDLSLDDPLLSSIDSKKDSGQTFYSARSVVWMIYEALEIPSVLLNTTAVAKVLHDIATYIEQGKLDGFTGLPQGWGDYYQMGGEEDDVFGSSEGGGTNIKAGRRINRKDQQSLNDAHKAIVDAGAHCNNGYMKSASTDDTDLTAIIAESDALKSQVTDLTSQLENANFLRESAETQLADLLK